MGLARLGLVDNDYAVFAAETSTLGSLSLVIHSSLHARYVSVTEK